jgi:hypothetical protein
MYICMLLVTRLGGKRPLERPRHKRVDNIKTDLRDIELGGSDRIDLALDRDRWKGFVNTRMNLRIP